MSCASSYWYAHPTHPETIFACVLCRSRCTDCVPDFVVRGRTERWCKEKKRTNGKPKTSETDALKELSMQTLTTLTYLLLPIWVYIFVCCFWCCCCSLALYSECTFQVRWNARERSTAERGRERERVKQHGWSGDRGRPQDEDIVCKYVLCVLRNHIFRHLFVDFYRNRRSIDRFDGRWNAGQTLHVGRNKENKCPMNSCAPLQCQHIFTATSVSTNSCAAHTHRQFYWSRSNRSATNVTGAIHGADSAVHHIAKLVSPFIVIPFIWIYSPRSPHKMVT